MNTLLLWLVPPCIGAVIGFLTNVLAIKMLFRPLRAYHIGRIRVPFTPGILPRERGALAKSIGGMVSRELLTPEIICKRLAKDDVRQFLRSAADKVSQKTDDYYPVITSFLIEFLKKKETKRELEAFGNKFLSNVLQKFNFMQSLFVSLGNYDSTLREKMPEIVNDFIDNMDNLLKSEQVRARIIGFLETKLGSDAGIDKILSFIDKSVPGLLEKFDVCALVEDRINSLPMDRVERIVLDVMADKFMWIDIFGAVLGFLIGLFQAGFSRLVLLH